VCARGGSYFSKDVNAIVALARSIDVDTPLLDAVLLNNVMQPTHFADIIEEVVGDLKGKVVAFLGLSFKPNTGDVRETRALPIIEMLHARATHIYQQLSACLDKIHSVLLTYYFHLKIIEQN